ncbi:MAG: helix-turn-helix domain-containing protein [Alphaproteobacteria bacterium]|nr:helix-turn-helix domain-containing protein [Alphaproteobacteria bacterium]
MDEKLAFINECLRGELPMTALCERYGISRDTGYRLLGRYPAAAAARTNQETYGYSLFNRHR